MYLGSSGKKYKNADRYGDVVMTFIIIIRTITMLILMIDMTVIMVFLMTM